MRWWVGLGSVLAMGACTSTNPAFESSGTTEAGPVLDGETTTGDPAPSTTGGTSSGGPTSTSAGGQEASTSDTSGSPVADLPVSPTALCDFDLFAINGLGELYALDPDTATAMLLLTDPRLMSWAIATDPATGMLYVNELAAPSTVWRVDPFSLTIEAEPLTVEAADLDSVARATFDGMGHLWLGTDDTHRFVWLPASGGSLAGDHTLDPFAWGGDMVFRDPSCAVVPTLDGALYDVCFPAMGGPLPTIPVLDLPAGPQFTGIAIDGSERLWLGTADPVRTVIEVERGESPWRAVAVVEYDMPMNDLATVIEPPGC